MGHSWASGLFVFGGKFEISLKFISKDAKNQESTSEAVNAYYAIYLLGLAMEDSYLADWGRLLLATEIRSSRKYWHITSDSEIYDKPFADNKIVGVLWSSKVDYATFFGGK
jgi:endo-1,3(4)-beta-glucanase